MVPGMCWRWWRCREAAGCWISCEVGLPKGLNVGCEIVKTDSLFSPEQGESMSRGRTQARAAKLLESLGEFPASLFPSDEKPDWLT